MLASLLGYVGYSYVYSYIVINVNSIAMYVTTYTVRIDIITAQIQIVIGIQSLHIANYVRIYSISSVAIALPYNVCSTLRNLTFYRSLR